MRLLTNHAVDAFNDWIGSYAGFVQALVLTILSIPLAIYGLDHSGFKYMWLATAISFIGTFSLGIFSKKMRDEQKKFEQWLEQILVNQSDTMRAVLAIAGEMKREQGEIRKEIEELAEEEA